MPAMVGPSAKDPEVPFDVERLVFFSDAVIAIAITLLVIQLTVPGTLATDADLRDALAGLMPSFFSFGLSFAVIGVWWASHYRLMRVLVHASGLIVFLNFVLLGAIVFLPFASGVLGHHGELPTAIMLYALTNLVAASTIVAMRIAASRLHLLREGAEDAAFRRRTAFTVGTAAVFGLSILIAPASPQLATYTWDLILVLILVRTWDERRRAAREAGRSPAG